HPTTTTMVASLCNPFIPGHIPASFPSRLVPPTATGWRIHRAPFAMCASLDQHPPDAHMAKDRHVCATPTPFPATRGLRDAHMANPAMYAPPQRRGDRDARVCLRRCDTIETFLHRAVA